MKSGFSFLLKWRTECFTNQVSCIVIWSPNWAIWSFMNSIAKKAQVSLGQIHNHGSSQFVSSTWFMLSRLELLWTQRSLSMNWDCHKCVTGVWYGVWYEASCWVGLLPQYCCSMSPTRAAHSKQHALFRLEYQETCSQRCRATVIGIRYNTACSRLWSSHTYR